MRLGGGRGATGKSHSRIGEEAGTSDTADLQMEPAGDDNVNKREGGKSNKRTDEKEALSA